MVKILVVVLTFFYLIFRSIINFKSKKVDNKDDTKIIKDLWKIIGNMEKRVENLETILLLDKERFYNQRV